MSKPKTNTLPAGWESATLGDVCDPPQYGWTTSASDVSSAVKLLRSTDISHGTVNWETVPFCETPPPAVEKYQLHPGDIVITRTGAGVGNSLLLDDCPSSVFASYLIRFRPHAALSAKYIAYFLKGPSYRSLISQNAAGIAQPNVNATKLASLVLPVAPRKTQDAIVAEIEKQFTRLDAVVAALKRVQANLKRYRAAILKAACEGRLVSGEAELASREGRPYEPASALLERILTERRAQGINRKRQYAEPSAAATDDSTQVPEGWIKATVEQVSSLVQYGSSAKTNEDSDGVVVLRMGNLTADGRLDLAELKYLPKNHDEFPELLLEKGDLLFNRTNSAELVGKSAVYAGDPSPCSFASYLIRVKTVRGCDSRYVALCVNSSLGRAWIKSVVSQQVGQANVNGTKLQAFVFPLPPQSEQSRILAEVERRLSIIDEHEVLVERALIRADRLRQAILKKAFAGMLVPQDPNDEPATLLLERIRNERDAKSGSVMPKGMRREVAVS